MHPNDWKLRKPPAAVTAAIAAVMAGAAMILPAPASRGLPAQVAYAATAARAGPGRPDVGRPLAGAARHQTAAQGAARALAHLAAEQRADRAAERAADARAAAQPVQVQQQGAGSAGSAAPPAPSGDPQQIAMGMLGSFGWAASQFGCLRALWNLESGWNVYASNPSSGAYGIPQALPGSKMASAGPDWQTSAATQIRWGLGYIASLYTTPCGAWAQEQARGWY